LYKLLELIYEKKKHYKQSRGILIMKKLTITIALILVVALAMPAFGSSFSDVPASHWSYNAINKLVAAGIVEGYPDGEYKGEQSMTRYEMAVMVSRALDNIVDEMEAMNEGLSTGQAEDVTAIVKSLMEKNTNEELSDAQAEEVADIVDALTFELRSELKVLGAQVDELDQDVEKLAATVEAMKVPEDNIEFGMDIKTNFEVASYDTKNDEELFTTMYLLQDGDVLDNDMPVGYDDGSIISAGEVTIDDVLDGTYTAAQYFASLGNIDEDATDQGDWEDGDEYPSEKRFWQEYDFNIAGNLGEAEFNLAVDTLTNSFASEHSAFGYEEGNSDTFEMDSALLEVAIDQHGFRIGDFADYHLTKYLTDEEDMEGLELTTNYWDTDFTAVVLGDDDDTDADYYGVEGTKDMTYGNLTGKLYQVRGHGFAANNAIDSTYLAIELTDFEVTEALTMGGELAFNSWDSDVDAIDNDDSGDDIYALVNGEFVATDALTINGMIETVGAEFYAIDNDLAGTDDDDVLLGDGFADVDYDKYQVGADYVVNENNTVMGSVAMVNYGDDSYDDRGVANGATYDLDDKLEYSVGWKNVYGNYTNNVSVEFTDNDDFIEDYDVRVIELGTEYVWDETLTLGAALVNKNEEDKQEDNEMNYNYLKGTADKKLADNVTWNTEFKYLVGDIDDGTDKVDGEVNSLTTSLSVSF
jgi:polyhydroxyalkanoate synthesis regulator phasin